MVMKAWRDGAAMELWQALVHEAAGEQGQTLDQAQEAYLVFVLLRYQRERDLLARTQALEWLHAQQQTGQLRADALRVGVPRAALEADAKTLVLRLSSGGANGIDFNFNGQTRFQAAAGGFNGTLALVKYAGGDIEILAPGAAASSKSGMISVYANDLNAVGASRLTVGSLPWVRYGQGGNHVVFDYWDGADSVFLRQGATLAAAEVLLVSSKTNGSIEIEAGASINTLGRGKAVYMPTTVSFTSRNPQCRGGFQWPVANAGADTRRNAAIRSRPDPGWSVQHRRLCRQYHLVFGRQHRVCHHEYLCTQ